MDKSNLFQSLEHMALIKTVIWLWKPIHSYKSTNFLQFRERWQEIVGEIKDNVRLFHLPKRLKEKITVLINPVGLQILRWMEYHNKMFGFFLPDVFCWTQQGTIDMKNTAEILIQKKQFRAYVRYKLACIYCLEEYIPVLWNEMDELQREDICESPFFSSFHPLVVYWTYVLSGNAEGMKKFIRDKMGQDGYTPHHVAFLLAAKSGNIAGAEYLLDKLSPDERNESLVTTAIELVRKRCYIHLHKRADFSEEQYTCVLFVLMSRMTQEETNRVFKSCLVGVLECLTDWPWQGYLVQILSVMWNCITEIECCCVLLAIARKQTADEKCIYKQLFADVWREIPILKRNSVKQYNAFLLEDLFRSRDVNNIKMIYQDVTGKRKLFLSKGVRISKKLIDDGEWGLLEFFVEEFAASRADVKMFKEKVVKAFCKSRFLKVAFSAKLRSKKKKLVETLNTLMDTKEQEIKL